MTASWAELPADVRAWMAELGRLDFQLSPAWIDNFMRHVDLGAAQPVWACWHDAGQPVAALALLLEHGSLRSLGNYYTTRLPLWLAPQATAEQARGWLAGLLRITLQAHPGVHSLRLQPMPAGSVAETALRAALQDLGCAIFSFQAFQNWALPVRSDWPDYLASRDGALRSTLSRKGRRFAAQGGRMETLRGGPALARGIAAYQAVYATSWKPPEPHPGFMPGLMQAAAQAGVLRLGLAWIGEQPVAAQVWLVAGGRADIFKLAHDPGQAALSPGSLLSAHLMQQAFEVDRVQRVDYLSGDDAYKRLWMSEQHPYVGLQAHRRNRLRGLAAAGRDSIAQALRAWRTWRGQARPGC